MLRDAAGLGFLRGERLGLLEVLGGGGLVLGGRVVQVDLFILGVFEAHGLDLLVRRESRRVVGHVPVDLAQETAA